MIAAAGVVGLGAVAATAFAVVSGGGASTPAPVTPRAAATVPSPAPPPASATPPAFRFAAIGDWGWGGPDQARVFGRVCRANAASPLAFLLTTGDNFYRPDGRATAANYTRPAACVIRAGIPWRAAWGNHDLGGDSTATVLGAKRHWYTFARGPLRVVVLDANVPGDTAQLRFLRTTLSRATEPLRIVAFHQPAYTAGLHAPGATQQRLWAPEFRRGGVALVLQGHNHAYERFVVGGVTYITTGGGGAPVYPCVRPSRTLRACDPVHHFLLLEGDASGVTVTAVAEDGTRVERVRVRARG